VATYQKTWTFGDFYSKLRSYLYTKPLFYALVVFLKKVDLNKNDASKKQHYHKK